MTGQHMSRARRKGRKAGRAWKREADMTNTVPPPPRCPYNGPELRADWSRGCTETSGRVAAV